MPVGRRLILGGVIVAGVTAYMAYVGASASWQYYLTAEECLTDAPALLGKRLRVSGKVASDSLRITADRREASFALETSERPLPVVCSGPLPDNLAEGIDVVVEGRLETTDLLRGDKVLTRCASKYQSEKAAATSASAQKRPAQLDREMGFPTRPFSATAWKGRRTEPTNLYLSRLQANRLTRSQRRRWHPPHNAVAVGSGLNEHVSFVTARGIALRGRSGVPVRAESGADS